MVESSYQGENVNGIDINIELNFSVAESMEDVAESDHLIVLAEGKNSSVPGVSNMLGGKVAAVDADYFTGIYDIYLGAEGERTSAHELGHLFGLTHSSGGGKKSNLMSQGRAEGKGNSITKSQLNSIQLKLENKTNPYIMKLNSGSNYNAAGLPNLGIGHSVMKLTNTKGREKKLTLEQRKELYNQ